MTSQRDQHTIIIHTLPNISRNKKRRTLSQLIEYNQRNIFIKKLFTKSGK